MGTQYIPLTHNIFAPIHEINQRDLWTIITRLWVKINFFLLFLQFSICIFIINPYPKFFTFEISKTQVYMKQIHIPWSKIVYYEFSIFRKKIENKRKKNIKTINRGKFIAALTHISVHSPKNSLHFDFNTEYLK